MGAKRRLSGTSKVNTKTNTQTDLQTHRQTDNIWTNQLIESIGPEGQCFENEEEEKKKKTHKGDTDCLSMCG